MINQVNFNQTLFLCAPKRSEVVFLARGFVENSVNNRF